jgi:hypothetical protein
VQGLVPKPTPRHQTHLALLGTGPEYQAMFQVHPHHIGMGQGKPSKRIAYKGLGLVDKLFHLRAL